MREGTEPLADRVAGPLTTEQQEIVEILDNSSRNLQKLIEQLLDYNRNRPMARSSGRKWILPNWRDRRFRAHSLPARAKMMSTELALGERFCLAEPTLLTSVLDNLYSNAVHYGAESGNIRIHSYRHGEQVRIDVANSGEPIPVAERNMIFEPFYQGSHLRKGAKKAAVWG